jgi:hypothetical protein
VYAAGMQQQASKNNNQRIMSSIDAIQDRIESLTVSLFEAVRNYGDKDPQSREAMATAIKNEYKAAVTKIETLSGADRSAAEQEFELNELSATHAQLKTEILELQEKLHVLNDSCSSELDNILNDPLCKCERS